MKLKKIDWDRVLELIAYTFLGTAVLGIITIIISIFSGIWEVQLVDIENFNYKLAMTGLVTAAISFLIASSSAWLASELDL